MLRSQLFFAILLFIALQPATHASQMIAQHTAQLSAHPYRQDLNYLFGSVRQPCKYLLGCGGADWYATKHLTFFEYIGKYGARDINAQEAPTGYTVLMIACTDPLWSCREIKDLLMIKDINLNITTHTGNTALHETICNNHAVSPDLLERMTKMYAIEVQYRTSYIIELLILLGADLNKTNVNGFTPLMLAAFHNKGSIVSQLLRADASTDGVVTKGEQQGKTFFDLVAEHPEMLTEEYPLVQATIAGEQLAELKAKVTIAAFSQKATTEKLAQQYKINPTEIESWKKELLSQAKNIFKHKAQKQ